MSECALLEWAAGHDGLPAQQYALLVMLARLADSEGRVSISKADLGARVGLKERQTYTVLQFLAARALITIHHNAGEGAGRLPSTYSLRATGSALPIAPMQCAADCPPATGNVLPIAPRQQTADCPPVGPPKENIKPPLEIYPEPLELGGSVAAQPRATSMAKRIATAVASPFLDPDKSHSLVTRGAIVAGWLASGIPEPLIVETIAAICEREAKPIGSWRYFDAAVRQAAADSQAIPITVEAFDGQRSQPYARTANGRPRSVLAAMASDLGRFSGK